MGYWAHVPWEVPEMTPWGLPPAVEAQMEGRGTGVWGMTMQGGRMPFNYGWPKYGPVSSPPLSAYLSDETSCITVSMARMVYVDMS